MRAACWLAAILIVAAGCASEPRATISPTGSEAGATPSMQALAVWRGRVSGHTVSYLATIDCSGCEAKGTYRITERQGTVVQALPVGGSRALTNPDQWSFTTVLVVASEAKGAVDIEGTNSTGRVVAHIDPDPTRTGDDFTYTVADITVS